MTEAPTPSEYDALTYIIDYKGRFFVQGFCGVMRMLDLMDLAYRFTPDYQQYKTILVEFVTQCSAFLKTSLNNGIAITRNGIVLGQGTEFFDQYPDLIDALSLQPISSIRAARARNIFRFNVPDKYYYKVAKSALIDFILPGVKSKIVQKGNYFYVPKVPDGSFCRFETVEPSFVNLFEQLREEGIPRCDLISPVGIVRQTMFDIARQNRQLKQTN